MKNLLPLFILFWLMSFGLCYTINFIVNHATQPYINANNEPTFRCGPDSNVCNGAQFQLNNSVIDTSSSKYDLTQHSGYVSLLVRNVTPTDAGSYQCRYMCNNSWVTSNNVIVLIFIPPIVFLVPDNAYYYDFVGNNVTLHCDALYYSNIQWQNASKNVIVENHKYRFQGNNLIIINVSVSDQKSYLCAANNQITHRATVTAILKVYMKPVVIAVSNSSVSVYEGNTTSLVCFATAIPRPNLVWSNNNDLHIGGRIQSREERIGPYSIRSTLTISLTQDDDRGVYKCTGVTNNGTSTVTFSLHVENVPVPYLHLFLFDSNATSVIIAWEAFGVSDSANITFTWGLVGVHDEIIDEQVVLQGSSFLSVSSLLPNTSYIFNATLLYLKDSIIVTTSPQEYSLLSSSFPSIHEMSSSASSVLFSSSKMTSFNAFPSSSVNIYPSVASTVTPTSASGENRNESIGTVVGVVVGCIMALLAIVVIVIIVGFCLLKQIERHKTSLNVQSLDKQNSLHSNCNLLDNLRGYPRSGGASLNSLNLCPGHNGLSPYHENEFQEMTLNPQYLVEPVSGLPALSQDSVSVYNACSSCPPATCKGGEKLYHIDSGGCEEFEMTDNPYFEYEAAKFYTDGESVSPAHYAELENHSNKFEYSNNNNYESCPPPPLQAVYKSDLSLSRTQSPRFQIVSEKRGDVREKVNLVQ